MQLNFFRNTSQILFIYEVILTYVINKTPFSLLFNQLKTKITKGAINGAAH